jgi:hypothetical protein
LRLRQGGAGADSGDRQRGQDGTEFHCQTPIRLETLAGSCVSSPDFVAQRIQLAAMLTSFGHGVEASYNVFDLSKGCDFIVARRLAVPA